MDEKRMKHLEKFYFANRCLGKSITKIQNKTKTKEAAITKICKDPSPIWTKIS